MILCVERLHDFCVRRGCMIFLRLYDFSHSLAHSGCIIYFFLRLCDFLWRGCVNFFVESLCDLSVERLHDLFFTESLRDFVC